MEIREVEVDFFKYCRSCKHKNKSSNEEPCNECMEYPYNRNRETPYNYEKQE